MHSLFSPSIQSCSRPPSPNRKCSPSHPTTPDPLVRGGPGRRRGRGGDRRVRRRRGGGVLYTPPALPLTCAGRCGGSGPRGGAAGGWRVRGASTELPLTLRCSHPP